MPLSHMDESLLGLIAEDKIPNLVREQVGRLCWIAIGLGSEETEKRKLETEIDGLAEPELALLMAMVDTINTTYPEVPALLQAAE
jgi:hypothetical protein